MNPKDLGDSYDLVKRFFCSALAALGYEVVVDPMFTGEWNGHEETYYRLIGARPLRKSTTSRPTALFVDPDTGVRKAAGKRYVSFDRMVAELQNHELVFVFDQSFPYQGQPQVVMRMREKLSAISSRGYHGFYYDSHARFLFRSRKAENLNMLVGRLRELGIPDSRLLILDSP